MKILPFVTEKWKMNIYEMKNSDNLPMHEVRYSLSNGFYVHGLPSEKC